MCNYNEMKHSIQVKSKTRISPFHFPVDERMNAIPLAKSESTTFTRTHSLTRTHNAI
eukprot:m.45046 g.45046  ORF g.45046 m.45046 type:complete len:57 (+) comp7199_c0_seq1:1845-2015(+)